MIQKIARSILTSYYKPVEKFIADPHGTQHRTLQYLIEHGKNTLYGEKMNFGNIQNGADLASKLPVIEKKKINSL